MSFADVWQYGFFADLLDSSLSYVLLFHLICGVISYLLGSINCGVLISRVYGKDIRSVGSGNAGATNMTRTFGKKAGALTFIGDFLKASVAMFICRLLMGIIGAYIGGIFCILGHAYPIYFKFKGGKGVVCIAAMGLFTNPIVLAIMLAVFAIILFGFKMVSLASIMTMIIYPMVLSNVEGVGIRVIYAIFAAFLVVFLHRKNIVRIYNHTESKISLGKKKKDSKEVKEEAAAQSDEDTLSEENDSSKAKEKNDEECSE